MSTKGQGGHSLKLSGQHTDLLPKNRPLAVTQDSGREGLSRNRDMLHTAQASRQPQHWKQLFLLLLWELDILPSLPGCVCWDQGAACVEQAI